MNPLVAYHLTMAAYHAAWAAFWLGHSRGHPAKAVESEPDSENADIPRDMTADSADGWLRERVRR